MKKEKKVFTITFHRVNNYGANLQAYALQKFLINNGYDSKIIDYDNYNVSDHYRILKKNKKNILKFLIHILPRLDKINYEIKRVINFNKFRKKLKMTNYCTNISDLSKVVIDCDAIVCGSDQIWNPLITGGYDKAYFLQFLDDDVKKISYAASCGSSKNIKDINLFRSFLDEFDNVSVRESDLQKFLIDNNIKNNVSVVLDPTLLLTKNEWESIIKKDRIIQKKYIFAYCVSNGNDLYFNTINYLAKKLNLEVVYFDKKCSKIKVPKKCCYCSNPIEFLSLMYHSEFVVTTSFHGFALSTILNKKVFVVLSTYPERLVTLADTLNIKDFFVKDLSDIDIILKKNINWDLINNQLDKERKISRNWLLKSIEK